MSRAEVMGLCGKAAATFIACLLLYGLPEAGAAESSLNPLTVIKQNDQLAISAHLDSKFFSQVEETITSGIPATFSYEIEVWRQTKLWADKSVLSRGLERVIMFNSLTNEYFVTQRDKTASWDRTSKDIEEAKGWISQVEALPLLELSTLDPTGTYYVRVRATVKTEQSPSVLKYMFLFLRPSAQTTPWEKSEPFVLKDLRALALPSPAPASTAGTP